MRILRVEGEEVCSLENCCNKKCLDLLLQLKMLKIGMRILLETVKQTKIKAKYLNLRIKLQIRIWSNQLRKSLRSSQREKRQAKLQNSNPRKKRLKLTAAPLLLLEVALTKILKSHIKITVLIIKALLRSLYLNKSKI